MSNTVVKKANENWVKIAKTWEMVAAPAKPSMEEIEIYKAISTIELSDKTKARVVILGSTPELRDMCGKYLADKVESVTCVDATEVMYRAMSGLVKTKHAKEKFIHGDWLKLSSYFEKESIDIVYGDHVLNNVGGHENTFFSGIKKILKKDGCFASKILHFDAVDETIKLVPAYKKLKECAKQYKRGKLNLKIACNNFSTYLLFASCFLNNKNELSLFYWSEQINRLDEQVARGGDRYEKEILGMCKKTWWTWLNIRWTQYEKPLLHKMLQKSFLIKDEVMSPGHIFSRQTSLYRLKKK